MTKLFKNEKETDRAIKAAVNQFKKYENTNNTSHRRNNNFSNRRKRYTRLFQSGLQYREENKHVSGHGKQGPGLVFKWYQNSSGGVLLSISTNLHTIILRSHPCIIDLFKAKTGQHSFRLCMSIPRAFIPTIIQSREFHGRKTIRCTSEK